MAYVDRRSLVLRYHVKRLFSLSQMRTRSVFHCGPRNEKQTRTLTDAEDCCEDVCIVLICGWSVDVLCQQHRWENNNSILHTDTTLTHDTKSMHHSLICLKSQRALWCVPQRQTQTTHSGALFLNGSFFTFQKTRKWVQDRAAKWEKHNVKWREPILKNKCTFATCAFLK